MAGTPLTGAMAGTPLTGGTRTREEQL